MADYSPTGVYAINAGNGTYVVPEYWVPRFADVLSKSTCWSPFVTGDIDGARLLASGQGDTVRCNYFGNIDIPSGNLTEGTFTADGTQTAYQTALTVYPFGHKIIVTGEEIWQVGQGLDSKAMNSIIYNSVQTWEDRIGAAALAATYNFDCRSATSVVQSASAGGTGGTTAMLPYHVRAMTAWLKRHNVPTWRQYGKNYDWVMLGPAGMFGGISSQTEFQQIAATQNPSFYASGALGIYQNVLFVEETGVGKCTYSTTAGTGVIFGGGAIIGDTTIGKAPNTYAMWSDTRDHPGRINYAGWNGNFAVGLVPAVGTITRALTVHAACE